jgi:hypothetical protein
MQDNKAKIDQIISEANDFRFGDYLSRGFEIFKKDIGGFVVFTLVFFVLSVVIGLIPIVGSIANSLVITPALTVGFYLVARKLDLGEQNEFGNYFKGFDFVGQLALAALVTSVISLLALIPFYLAFWNPEYLEWYQEVVQNPGSPPPSFPELPPFWSFLLLLPVFYIGIVYGWTYLFIAFHKLDFWPAMEASRRLLTKHFFIYFIFMLVLGIIMFASILVFCIGILAGFPIIMCMNYAAFADLTKLNATPDAGEEIEQHLIV